jgi:hypothetical protein
MPIGYITLIENDFPSPHAPLLLTLPTSSLSHFLTSLHFDTSTLFSSVLRCVYALSGGVRRAHLLAPSKGALLKELYTRHVLRCIVILYCVVLYGIALYSTAFCGNILLNCIIRYCKVQRCLQGPGPCRVLCSDLFYSTIKCTVSYFYVVLSCTVMYSTTLNCTALYGTTLYINILYNVLPHCNVLS